MHYYDNLLSIVNSSNHASFVLVKVCRQVIVTNLLKSIYQLYITASGETKGRACQGRIQGNVNHCFQISPKRGKYYCLLMSQIVIFLESVVRSIRVAFP